MTLSPVTVEKKTTWALHLNRTDTRQDVFDNLHVWTNKDKVVINFQCDAGTKPTIQLVEVE
jgi:hypothetical protein